MALAPHLNPRVVGGWVIPFLCASIPVDPFLCESIRVWEPAATATCGIRAFRGSGATSQLTACGARVWIPATRLPGMRYPGTHGMRRYPDVHLVGIGTSRGWGPVDVQYTRSDPRGPFIVLIFEGPPRYRNESWAWGRWAEATGVERRKLERREGLRRAAAHLRNESEFSLVYLLIVYHYCTTRMIYSVVS